MSPEPAGHGMKKKKYNNNNDDNNNNKEISNEIYDISLRKDHPAVEEDWPRQKNVQKKKKERARS